MGLRLDDTPPAGEPLAEAERAATRRRPPRRRTGLKLLLVLTGAVIASFVAWRVWTAPTTLVVAVAETNPEDVKVVNAFARAIRADADSGVVLRVRPVADPAAAVEAFVDRKADLVIARADADLKGQGAAIALLRRSYAIVLSLDPQIDDFAKLRGKRVGLLGKAGDNDPLLAALLGAYDMTPADISRMPLDGVEALRAVEGREVDAVIGVSSLSIGRSAETLRALLALRGSTHIAFLPIDRAPEVVSANPAFEERELERGALMGYPSHDVSAVSIATYLVARASLDNSAAATLARQFLSNRQAVVAQAPSATQIEAPSVARDAFMRTHPGAANYIENEEESFFDRYGDLLYIFMAVGGLFGSAAIALLRRVGPDRESEAHALIDELVALRGALRAHAIEPPADRREAIAEWRKSAAEFETLLTRAIALIGDRAVGERTGHGLQAALMAAERAVTQGAAMMDRTRDAPHASPMTPVGMPERPAPGEH